MLNPHLDQLTDYPFQRLRDLLDVAAPAAGLEVRNMTIGEPRHKPPAWVAEELTRQAADWGRYPPVAGSEVFCAAVGDWLSARYKLPPGRFDGQSQVVPVSGTREALFMTASLVMPEARQGGRPTVLMPNPFYQVYLGATVMAGAEPVLLPATRDTGFLPDLDAIAPETLDRCALMFICSPANPQGAVASLDYLVQAIALARRHGFVLAMDECYAEIWDKEPPAGALAACEAIGDGFDNVLVFHSLSKRSSLPGLRSGFVAGDAKLIKAMVRLRNYGGAAPGLPIQTVSAALWRDEDHVLENRALYRAKFDAAEAIIGDRFGFVRPAAGFFLWLDVGDGERAAQTLWQKAAVRVLPGAYLARPDASGFNPGHAYIRVALVDDLATTSDGLTRLVNAL